MCHISNPMIGSLIKMITFMGLANSWEERAFPITKYTYAVCAIGTFDKGETKRDK
jgi:hypothetical protein